MGHGLMVNRHGLLVEACLTLADGHAERVAARHMVEPRADRPKAITLGADKAYDTEDFVNKLRSMKVTPHVARNPSGRSSAIDGRTTGIAAMLSVSVFASAFKRRSAGSRRSLVKRQTKFRCRDRVGWGFTFAVAAYNLVRLPKLIAGAQLTWPRFQPSPRPLPVAGVSSKWMSGTTISSISSKRRI
jgi:hypothetical protein